MRLLLIITIAALLTSCAIPDEYVPPVLKAPEQVASKEVEPLSLLMEQHRDLIICCRSFKEFGYERLRLPGSKSFNINKHSSASSFSSGKSFFRAFALPEFSSPYTISIESYVQGKNLTDGYVFSPAIIFLNEDHQITRTILRGLFEYTGDGPAKPLTPNAALAGKIDITHENKNYRYMIILTQGNTLGKAHEHSPTREALAALTGKKVPLIHAPAGKLRINLYRENDEG